MKRLSLVLGLVMAAFLAFGQDVQRTITGVVRDGGGESVIGASVLIKGTTTGTVTDIDGNFSLNTTAAAPILVISYTGYGTQEVQVGGADNYEVTLDEGIEISEVVVTALGVERRKDDDLSSATLINTEDMRRSGETGVIQSLAGKTSGVQITRNSGDPGAGAYIQIRGQNTLLGDASPLIILDGVPISNTSTTAGGGGGGNVAGVSQQSRLNDINPNDIASLTVLKGASAAAVYGTGAANGVIVITTKTGASGNRRKFSVNFTSSLGFDQVNSEHPKQGLYGQGSGGNPALRNSNTGNSWGDLISARAGGDDVTTSAGAYFIGDQTGTRYDSILVKNSREVYNQSNRDQIFQTGITAEANLGLNFNTEASNTFLSFSRLDQEGILKGNSNYERNTIRLNNRIDLLPNLNFRLNSSWTGTNSNRIQQGSNTAGLYLGYLRTSPDFDNTDYSGQYFNAAGVPTPSQRTYRNPLGNTARGPIYNNPGWTANRQDNSSLVNRFIVSPEANWIITKGLTATVRYGLDFYTDVRGTYYPQQSGDGRVTGEYDRDDISERTQNVFTFLTGEYQLADKLGFGFNVGYNLYDNQYSRNTASVNTFFIDDPSKRITENGTAANQDGTQVLSRNRKHGGFGVFNFDFDDKLFVELTGRLERTATIQNKIFFYPSASLGYKLFDDPSAQLSFAKLRVSYGQIGIEPPTYVNRDLYGQSTSGSEGYGNYYEGLNFGGTFARSITQGNPNLTVENVAEVEVGGDFRFFENKVTFGATYYDRKTRDAILPIQVPASTGYAETYANAAEITNKGLEVDAGYRLFQSEDFNVRVFGNFSRNRNIVTKLPDVSNYFLAGFAGTASVAIEGQPFGVLYSAKFARNEDGTYALNERGFPVAEDESSPVGNPNPNWRGGLGSEVNFKGLTLTFLFETSQGQKMWAGTYGVLNTFGINPITANQSTSTQDLLQSNGVVIPAGTTFRGNIQDFGGGPVALTESWYSGTGGGFGVVGEQFIYDASWTRLREVGLSYSIPPTFTKSIGLQSATIGVTGRNLIFWSKFPNIDPDLNLTGASKGRGLDYFTNPTTRSVLINLNIGF